MQSSEAITSVASTVSQSVKQRVIATARRMYRPAADLKTKEGIQYAVAEYFHYLSRGGQSLLEELVLAKQHTPLHIKVRSTLQFHNLDIHSFIYLFVL